MQLRINVTNMKKTKSEIQQEAVESILRGDLLLEEAMEKYQIKDKRTIANWVKKLAPKLASVKTDASNQQDYANLRRETTLLRKITALQERVQQLEEEKKYLRDYVAQFNKANQNKK